MVVHGLTVLWACSLLTFRLIVYLDPKEMSGHLQICMANFFKSDQSTERFSRLNFARLFKFTLYI